MSRPCSNHVYQFAVNVPLGLIVVVLGMRVIPTDVRSAGPRHYDVTGALFAMFFFVTLYLQQVLGDDALQAGLSFLPITLSVFTASSFAPRLVARFGVRTVVTAGMLIATAGLLLLTGMRPGGSYFAVVLPGGILSGLGMVLGLVPSTIAATQGVPRTQSRLPLSVVA